MRLLRSLVGSVVLTAALWAGCSSDEGGTADAASNTTATDGTDSGDGGTDSADGTDQPCPDGFVELAGQSCTEGEPLFNITLKNCDGDEVQLADIVCQSKATLVYFGAGWCQPCREKQPKILEWDEKYAKDGLQIVEILIQADGPQDPATSAFCSSWKAEYSLPFPVLIDPLDKYTSACLGGGQLPVTAIIAPDWTVQYKALAEADDTEAVIQALLAQ